MNCSSPFEPTASIRGYARLLQPKGRSCWRLTPRGKVNPRSNAARIRAIAFIEENVLIFEDITGDGKLTCWSRRQYFGAQKELDAETQRGFRITCSSSGIAH